MFTSSFSDTLKYSISKLHIIFSHSSSTLNITRNISSCIFVKNNLPTSSRGIFKISNFPIFSNSINKASYSNMPLFGVKHDWRLNLSSEEFNKKTDDLISRCRKLYDQVAAVPDSEVSYETVIKVLNEIECDIRTERYFLDSAQHFATNENVRKASVEADRKIRDFEVETSMRHDIYKKLLVLEKNDENLEKEPKRYLKNLLLAGKRNGLHLSEDVRKHIKELRMKVNNIAIDFCKNLNEVTTTLEFTDEELDGMTSDFLKGLNRNEENNKAIVTLKYPHYFPIMEKCKVPETRRRIQFAFNSQCIDENGPILDELRKLRHEIAVKLGYANHSDYMTEILMSKSAKNVENFLMSLAKRLAPLWTEEKKYLLELKKAECEELGVPFDEKLNSWDMTYYTTMAKEKKYSVDQNTLKEYFPMPVVKKGLLDIYQELLGLKFHQVEGQYWHEDVEMYSVQDSANGQLLGYFFLDLFPRLNKYGHAALFECQMGFSLPNGTRQPAIGALVTNFSKPQGDKPALMDHNEVTTFFHEFGHVMHHLCIQTEMPVFYIMEMERDFIEAPSQMLENWCWEAESLKKMSSHYLDNSPLPDELIDSLVKSRLANVGYKNMRQIILALFDQKIHSSPEGDIRQIYNELTMELVGLEPQAGTNFACQFAHLATDYDARYYGYMWSEVFSMDMFQTRFGDGNVLNSAIGNDYRKKVLEPGATKDAIESLKDFLGREPNQDAFLKSKGLLS